MRTNSNPYITSFDSVIIRYDAYLLMEYVRNFVTKSLHHQPNRLQPHTGYRAEQMIERLNERFGYASLTEEEYAARVIAMYLMEYGLAKSTFEPKKESERICLELCQQGRASTSMIRKIQHCLRTMKNSNVF